MSCQTLDFSGTFVRIVHVGRLAIHDRAGLVVAATNVLEAHIETVELWATSALIESGCSEVLDGSGYPSCFALRRVFGRDRLFWRGDLGNLFDQLGCPTMPLGVPDRSTGIN